MTTCERCTKFGSVSDVHANAPSLPFGDLLSSTGSATAVAALFARFVGTTKSSDFPSAFMPAVPSERFSDRPRGRPRTTRGTDGISRGSALGVSRHAQVLRLRRAGALLANSAEAPCCLPQPPQRGHTGLMISELNSWPACTSCRCHTRHVTVASVRFEAAVAG